MEENSMTGVLGGVLGMGVGWLEYKIVGGAVERKLRETDRSRTEAERADYERRIVVLRRTLFVFMVGTSLVVGYLLARAITR
jgi:hypothetical protein